MSSLNNADHPLWAFLRFLLLTLAVTFLLWRNASSFDETEIKTILEIACIVGGYEGLNTYMRSKKN